MINIQFSASETAWATYQDTIVAACGAHGLEIDLRQDHAAENVDYIIYAPTSDLQDFAPYTRCKAVLSLWAGVERIVGNSTLTMPLCRMVDPGLTAGMVEWVAGHVLRYHLDLDRSLQTQDRWAPKIPPLAQQRQVSILGLGALGTACAAALAALGFSVTGWSRSAKHVEGITSQHGEAGLKSALQNAEILVLLLPDTAATQNILNADRLALLPQGARIINPGRGTLIDDAALLDSLNSGHIAHATLDVFRQEPLPQEHPYWAHPHVTVTPHIAAETRPITASDMLAQNIARSESGQPLLHEVDRQLGY